MLSKKFSYIFTSILLISLVIILSLGFPESAYQLSNKIKDNTLIINALIILSGLFPVLLLLFSETWKSARLQQKILIFAISALVVSLQFSVRYIIDAYVFFIVSCIILFIYQRKPEKPALLFFVFIAYFLLHLFSLLWVDNVDKGLRVLERYVPFLLLALASLTFTLTKKERDLILLIFFRASMVFVFISLLSWTFHSQGLKMNLENWLQIQKMTIENIRVWELIYAWTNFKHPSYVATLVSAALGFGFYLIRKENSEKNLSVSLFEFITYAAGAFTLALITQSRTSLVQVIIVFIAGLAWLIPVKTKLKAGVLLGIILLFSITIFIFPDKIPGFFKDPTREQIYKTAIYSIKQQPFTGTGIGGMQAVIKSDSIARAIGYEFSTCKYTEFAHEHAHNQFLSDWMQTGIGGFIIVVIMTLWTFFLSFRERNFPLFIFMCSFSLLMLIETPLMLHKGIFIYTVFAGLVLKKIRENQPV